MDRKPKSESAQTLVSLRAEFLGSDHAYYQEQFRRLDTGVSPLTMINWAAVCLGPLWAAVRGVWLQFWVALSGETIAAVYLFRAIWVDGEDINTSGLVFSLGAMVILRLAQGTAANWLLWRSFSRWRHGRRALGDWGTSRLFYGVALSAAFIVVAIYRYGVTEAPGFISKFPAPRVIQKTSARSIDAGVDWTILHFEAFFDSVTVALREILDFLEAVFIGVPWPLMAILVVALAWRAAGWKIAVFSVLALVYLGLFGYWEKSMSTMSLVAASALVCLVIGMPLGIWCGKDARAYAVVKPVLDFMQTMPSFVYLIPAVAFFSIGKPPGVFATVIFAMPPMIRLAALGIQQVPYDVKEAAIAFGASPWKLLLKIELPLAVPSLMAGVNQTIMMSLSMVIIASMIGAGGLGYDVLKALRLLNTGEGMLAGTAIVLCAMVLDRIVQGRAGSKK